LAVGAVAGLGLGAPHHHINLEDQPVLAAQHFALSFLLNI
jgi:hypothetical protein